MVEFLSEAEITSLRGSTEDFNESAFQTSYSRNDDEFAVVLKLASENNFNKIYSKLDDSLYSIKKNGTLNHKYYNNGEIKSLRYVYNVLETPEHLKNRNVLITVVTTEECGEQIAKIKSETDKTWFVTKEDEDWIRIYESLLTEANIKYSLGISKDV